MTTLPSFVELISTLGVDSASKALDHSASSPRSSRSASPHSLYSPISSRDRSVRHTSQARYSPYSPTLSSRRGSVSSSSTSSSSPDLERRVLPNHPGSPRIRKRKDNKLTVNVFGSSTDLSATTPISIYVRRKTPGASPTTSIFVPDSRDTSATYGHLLTLPTLPSLLPLSPNSDHFPITPDSDEKRPLSDRNSNSPSPSPVMKADLLEGHIFGRFRCHTGTRISTPPRSADSERHPRPYTVHIENLSREITL
ncbi:uncharacterized protein EV420DRAFT_441769 [Desarmillaria tabescens]|uniref:Uncharacterized protein n=1 Tax=Armillaria tabescens TaxID=1929756 RepID=A0AA39NLV2_ARMTA|nr:uncharacterized protein EV420DRAFT_441769 [Desarmillaria tabescens]KAK0468032.1 hypothetical protein EV420DRAFT_441769 [Desarmillaria tabescens]